MSHVKAHYDAIIIGAGIGGLVCGCYLAKAGMKVLIVEQHDKPGGYFTSFKRKGFMFDAAAHSFGNYRKGGRVRNILTDLGVDKIVKINRFDPSDIILTPDFKMTFWNDLKATISDLSTTFPTERSNFENFFNFCLTSDQSEFAKLKDKTFKSFLHSFFKDEKIINAFALPVLGNGGLPPSLMHAFSGTKIFTESLLDGGYYPEGIMQNLPDALVHILKQNGGNILYNNFVKKIVVQNGMVTGVKLDTVAELHSKYVVSACDMTQTFRSLLGGDICSPQLMKSLDALVPSASTFILYLGIDSSFEGLPNPGTNVWYLPAYNLDEIYSHIQKSNFSESMYMMRVSPSGNSIVAFMHAPFETSAFWDQNKKKTIDIFLSKIEQVIPDIRKHIVYYDAATPATLHRYTLNYQGAAFGWAKTLSQTFDPLFKRTTFLEGFYLTGHWTSIATGMPGVCYLAHDTASRIIKKERKKLEPLQS
jgi:phytoene dehydrogenase-like protein